LKGENGKKWSANQLKAAIAAAAAIEKTKKVEFDAEKLGKFVIIYADPAWQYENPPMGGSNRSIENQYPTDPVEEIRAMQVANIAYENAVLMLWSTNPKLAEAMTVIEAWGFTYRTNMVWMKADLDEDGNEKTRDIGMGYHVREKHEILLIAKRGELPAPQPGDRPDSVIASPRMEHSAKPKIFYDIIDKMYPGVRKIELFAREHEPRSLWSYWGNQARPLELEAAE
jgi:N6-adenosine-specific RNA methylase IME4